MPATPFLSPSTLPKSHSLPSYSKLFSHSCILISSSLNPKPTNRPHTSTSPVSFTTENPDSKPIKMPTPPWIRAPLVLQPHELIDLSKSKNDDQFTDRKAEKSGNELTDKLVGRRGKNVIKKIARRIEELGKRVDSEETQKDSTEERGIGECLEGLGEAAGDSRPGERMPWERDEGFVFRRMKKEKVVSSAELRLERELLDRLRGEARKMRKWVKVKKAGVTAEVVEDVKFFWRSNELAMVKFDVPLCRNMDRAQEILEMKTGGLVVWRRKDILGIYRGCNYQPTLEPFPKTNAGRSGHQDTSFSDLVQRDFGKRVGVSEVKSYGDSIDGKISKKNAEGETIPATTIYRTDADFQSNSSLYEREADRLLDGLGPRFIDWWMNKPLPVDADLLPEVVPGFRPPYRRCPPHTRSKLADDELTYLRKLARTLPTHFVLGRNRKLQGLAAAILKLWEKSPIAKIAVKLGVPNTNNEQMTYELKCLTGGVLLLRNKFFIILYRGKDFLPGKIAELITKRETELEYCQLHEEHARLEVAEKIFAADEPLASTGPAGTLSEFQDIQSEYGDPSKENIEVKLPFEAEKERLEMELRKQERKLFILNSKIEKSKRELLKLNAAWKPSEQDADLEMLTEEERECFRKIGLQMQSVLVLGRRGIFDGVMEGLHQHWKHREVAKVITMQRYFWRVMHTAKLLEAESGGVLISVEKLKEGHAIIIYRGKNYRRPLKLISANLLTKRKALSRSLELQRIGSLKFFAYQRQRAISDLKVKLENLHNILKVDRREHASSRVFY